MTQSPHLPSTSAADTGPGVLRPLLWIVLVVSVVGNTVASFAGVPTTVHLGLGVTTAICVVALVAQQLRTRR